MILVLDSRIPSGKYSGASVFEVLIADPEYIIGCYHRNTYTFSLYTQQVIRNREALLRNNEGQSSNSDKRK